MNAAANENKKAMILRSMAERLPNYLISRGRVITPTIIREDMNAPICIYPAPVLGSIAAVGKAIKSGISVIAPITDVRMVPDQHERLPRIRLIVSASIKARIIPTNVIIARSCGSIVSSAFPVFHK